MYVHEQCWLVVFLSYNVCLILVLRYAAIIDRVSKCFLCFYFLEEIMENWCHFLLKYLIKFPSEAIWAWRFPF